MTRRLAVVAFLALAACARPVDRGSGSARSALNVDPTLPVSPLLDAGSGRDQSYARVAGGAAGFLVSWEELVGDGDQTFGQLYDPNGCPLGGTVAFPFQSDGGVQGGGHAVATDGRSFLLVQAEAFQATTNFTAYLVAPDGSTSTGVALCPASAALGYCSHGGGQVAVASNGQGYLVTWLSNEGSTQRLIAAFVRADGGASPAFVARGYDLYANLALAGSLDGGPYFVGFSAWDGGDVGVNSVARIEPDGGLDAEQSFATVFDNNGTYAGYLAIASDGNQVALAWSESDGGYNATLTGPVLDAALDDAGPDPQVLSSGIGGSSLYRPTMAFDGRSWLLASPIADGAAPTNFEIQLDVFAPPLLGSESSSLVSVAQNGTGFPDASPSIASAPGGVSLLVTADLVGSTQRMDVTRIGEDALLTCNGSSGSSSSSSTTGGSSSSGSTSGSTASSSSSSSGSSASSSSSSGSGSGSGSASTSTSSSSGSSGSSSTTTTGSSGAGASSGSSSSTGGASGSSGSTGSSSGSDDLFGCSAGGGFSGWALLGLLALGLRRRRTGALALALAVSLSATARADAPKRQKAKVAVLTFKTAEGVSASLGSLVSVQLASEIEKRTGQGVISSQDVETALGFERTKQLLGCAESSCLAELGGALGVERVVSGELARVGHSLTFDAQLVDITHAVVLKRYSHRIQNATSDEAFLDEIAPAVAALFPEAQPATPTAAVAAPPQVQTAPAAEPAPRFVIALGGAAELTGKGAMASARLGYDLSPNLELRAEGLYTGRSYAGAAPGVAFVPFAEDGLVRPELGAAVPILFSSPVSIGGELLVGAQLVPVPWLVASVEVPAMFFAAAPDGQRKVYAFAQGSVGARF